MNNQDQELDALLKSLMQTDGLAQPKKGYTQGVMRRVAQQRAVLPDQAVHPNPEGGYLMALMLAYPLAVVAALAVLGILGFFDWVLGMLAQDGHFLADWSFALPRWGLVAVAVYLLFGRLVVAMFFVKQSLAKIVGKG